MQEGKHGRRGAVVVVLGREEKEWGWKVGTEGGGGVATKGARSKSVEMEEREVQSDGRGEMSMAHLIR